MEYIVRSVHRDELSAVLDLWARAKTEPTHSNRLLASHYLGRTVTTTPVTAAFVRRFQFRVYGLACRMVGDKALAEDIAQEAFLRAWRRASDFDSSRGSVTTWLLAITRNLGIDALRRRQGEPVDPDLLRSLEPDAQAKAPDELAADNDAALRLREVIGDLPTEQRRALVLAYFYGRTAHQISISEGIPLGTAKTRIRAAMTKLRATTLSDNARG